MGSENSVTDISRGGNMFQSPLEKFCGLFVFKVK